MQQATDDLIVRLGDAALAHAIPLILLLTIFTLLGWVLYRAQSRDDFDASQFLRDELGHLSIGRLIACVCFGVHTWAYSVWVVRGVIESSDTLAYMAWGGILLGLRGMDIYRSTKLGVVPPGMEPVPPSPTPQQ